MELAERISGLLERREWSVAELANRAGLKESNVRNILRGLAKDPGASKLYAIAAALGASMESLLGLPTLDGDHEVAMEAIELPIRYRVGGGWFEQDDYVQDQIGKAEVSPLRRFAAWPQWLEVLDGESMSQIMPSGSLLHVVDAPAMGYVPARGDIVIVERSRDGGFLRERTAKQVDYGASGLELWARSRSDNPKWKKPIVINDGPEDETVEAKIVGLVVRTIFDTVA